VRTTRPAKGSFHHLRNLPGHSGSRRCISPARDDDLTPKLLVQCTTVSARKFFRRTLNSQEAQREAWCQAPRQTSSSSPRRSPRPGTIPDAKCTCFVTTIHRHRAVVVRSVEFASPIASESDLTDELVTCTLTSPLRPKRSICPFHFAAKGNLHTRSIKPTLKSPSDQSWPAENRLQLVN
jgi:hypothetical protein